MSEIPIIDFAGIFDSNSTEAIWEAKTEEIREACHSIGFMYVVNHGIPQKIVSRIKVSNAILVLIWPKFLWFLDSSSLQRKQEILRAPVFEKGRVLD